MINLNIILVFFAVVNIINASYWSQEDSNLSQVDSLVDSFILDKENAGRMQKDSVITLLKIILTKIKEERAQRDLNRLILLNRSKQNVMRF